MERITRITVFTIASAGFACDPSEGYNDVEGRVAADFADEGVTSGNATETDLETNDDSRSQPALADAPEGSGTPHSASDSIAAESESSLGGSCSWERLTDTSGTSAGITCPVSTPMARAGTCYAQSTSHRLVSNYPTEALFDLANDGTDSDDVTGWACEWDTAATGASNQHIVAALCCPASSLCTWERLDDTSGTPAGLTCPNSGYPWAGGCYAADSDHILNRNYATDGLFDLVNDATSLFDATGWACEWDTAATSASDEHIVLACCGP